MQRSARSFVAACVLAAGTLASITTTASAQVGTAITYQGVLERNNVKVNTATDMRFTLFTAASGGSQVGNVVTLDAQNVSNGLFNVALDFGVDPYTADAARWMQIEVRNPTGSGAFVPMGARQKLTPAAFSLATRGINVPANGEVHALGTFKVPANSAIFTHGGATNNGGRLHIQSGNDGTFDGLFLNPFPNGGNVYMGNGAGAANLICYDNVGIGTGQPGARLQIDRGPDGGKVLLLNNPVNSWGTADVFRDYRYIQTSSVATDGNWRQFNVAPGGVSIGYPNTPAYGAADAMFINGNVCIGSNEPASHKLVVVDPGNGNTQRFIGPLGAYGWGARLFWGDSDYVRISEPDDDVMLLHARLGVNSDVTFSAPAKNFRIDHPSDPANMILNHGCIESDQYVNLYRGNAIIGNDGGAWIQLPSWMNDLNTDFSYQLTSVGAAQPNLYVAVEVNNRNQFYVAGGQPGAKVSWQVTGVRHDAFVRAHPLVVEEVKTGSAAGTYLSPNSFGIFTQEELAKRATK